MMFIFGAVSMVFSVHAHSFQNLARQFVNRSDETVIPVYKYPGGPNLKALEFYKGPLIDLHDDSVIALPNGQSNELPPAQLHVHSTPGHSDDHICLLLRANNRPVHLFVGDLILGRLDLSRLSHLPSISLFEFILPGFDFIGSEFNSMLCTIVNILLSLSATSQSLIAKFAVHYPPRKSPE